MIGGNPELDHYVTKAHGISRMALNVVCCIGLVIFIFGWLLLLVFLRLGKNRHAFLYLVPMILVMLLAQVELSLGLIAPIIYVGGWIHANVILSRLQTSARQRIAQIDGSTESELTADALLEKGLLELKVLRQSDSGPSTLNEALGMPDGNPQMLYLAGVAMSGLKRYEEAKRLLETALERYAKARELLETGLTGAMDESLLKQTKQHLAYVLKKIK